MAAISNTGVTLKQEEVTEWEEILVKKGILLPREKPKTLDQAIVEKANEAVEYAKANPHDHKTVAELDQALEDDDDEDRAIENMRARRLAELKAKRAREKFGSVREIARNDFVVEVTEASKDHWVCLHLYNDEVRDSRLMGEVFAALAPRHKAAKFLKIRSTSCIEGWPDANLPTLIIYHDGEMVEGGQIMGLAHVGGRKGLSVDALEWSLSRIGALKTELMEAPWTLAGGGGGGGGGGDGGRGQTIAERLTAGRRGIAQVLDEDSDDEW